MPATHPRIAAWLDALLARHTAALTRPELLKAIRALSARYVERRAELPRRSPIDSAGKRAAFAVFYAPMHFLTVSEITRRLGAGQHPPRTIVDLGCGTGVASAAWAMNVEPRNPGTPEPATPHLLGVDRDGWALGEARWNWQMLGLRGSTRRGDLQAALDRAEGPADGTAFVLGWSVNELDAAARTAIAGRLVACHRRSSAVLVIEPLARRAVPWWDEWAGLVASAGGRADEWSLDVEIPPALARLDADAGFDRRALTARSLFLPPC